MQYPPVEKGLNHAAQTDRIREIGICASKFIYGYIAAMDRLLGGVPAEPAVPVAYQVNLFPTCGD